MAKNETFTTPAGRAMWPKLTEPDTKFKEAGEYSVKLLLTEAQAAPILKKCEELQQQAFDEEFEKKRAEKPKMSAEKIKADIKRADLPIRPYEDPETGEETGEFQATFKMTASGVSKKTGKPWTRKPYIFDAHNKPIDPAKIQIGSGSVLKVAYGMKPFCTAIGAGVSLLLEAVQVIDLVTYGQRDAAGFGFGAEDGGYSHTSGDDDSAHGTPFSADGDDGDAAAESDF